jgi:hypothetical protein
MQTSPRLAVIGEIDRTDCLLDGGDSFFARLYGQAAVIAVKARLRDNRR